MRMKNENEKWERKSISWTNSLIKFLTYLGYLSHSCDLPPFSSYSIPHMVVFSIKTKICITTIQSINMSKLIPRCTPYELGYYWNVWGFEIVIPHHLWYNSCWIWANITICINMRVCVWHLLKKRGFDFFHVYLRIRINDIKHQQTHLKDVLNISFTSW